VTAVVSARALVKTFGATRALDGVDLAIERGEMFALIGPDGAGKTTFFRLAAGVIAPTSGSLEIAPGLAVGYVPQRFGLYEDLSVDENLRLRLALYSLPMAEGRLRARELLERVGLAAFGARAAGALSGGMKQKLALVAALLTRPELLLLDEPTTGVDPVSRREFWVVLNGLFHEGLTIVVSTPYMDEAEYATRVGFLDRGRLSAAGTRREVIGSYGRALAEIRSPERLEIRRRLAALESVDDVSLFGTRLHVRGAAGVGDELVDRVRAELAGLVDPDDVRQVAPTLEDVFVLRGEEAAAE
jgi:ABC-2 type transport system ATP-binding protein